ncbi:MAG TPA: hypothetical protein VJT33_08330 [bacterium]|nr:hypothetical protein [bacterium]
MVGKAVMTIALQQTFHNGEARGGAAGIGSTPGLRPVAGASGVLSLTAPLQQREG